MFIAPANSRKRRGFTLLEIMLAVAIMAMMSVAIYRFVQSNLIALRVSSETTAADARFDALRSLLSAQWQSLPSGVGALSGEPLKVGDVARDQITWTCGAGPGLLTRYARGDFLVSLRLHDVGDAGRHIELGVLRKQVEDKSFSNAHESWVPLVENVRSLQIRYFDPRLNVWQEKWTDNVTLPRLVKVTVARSDAATPWEAIIALGRTSL